MSKRAGQMQCTPAARRGGSLNSRLYRASAVTMCAPRQPAGVGVSTLVKLHPQPVDLPVHPGSPPGWESQQYCGQQDQAHRRVHPGSPPGWESQRRRHLQRRLRPRAPRQPAGVGVSTSISTRPAARRSRAPRQPAGVGVSTSVSSRVIATSACAPRQPAGVGVSTSAKSASLFSRSVVHPGSPPGWESQPRREDGDDFDYRVCTPAARRGGSLNLRREVVTTQDHRCTPAARRGGSLNGATDAHLVPDLERAPRQPAGVGVSTPTGHASTASSSPCTPAARRGGSLNDSSHSETIRDAAWCTPAARRGGSLNLRWLRHDAGIRSAPRQPAGVGVSTPRRTGS